MRRNIEEAANAVTHGVGVLASLAGGSFLIVWAALHGSARSIVGAAVFVAAMLLLYSASTTYHSVSERLKPRFKVLDHCAIYLLIAGTYTPFMIGSLRGAWGWSLFGVIWGVALAGVIFKLFFTGRFALFSTGLYVAMGWLVLLAAGPLMRVLHPAAIWWLLAGGISYTSGTVFYHSRRIPFAHAVWHVFVLAGTTCHAIAVGLQL